MKVHVDAPWNLSHAMFRVARALRNAAPDGVRIVTDEREADLRVLHVIGFEALAERGDVAVIQYCVSMAAPPESARIWWPLWARARAVWSYYDLSAAMPPAARFYHAPLGVDAETFKFSEGHRDIGVLTSGFVHGPGAEAIEEVSLAAERCGLTVRHLGPNPVGMERGLGAHWSTMLGVKDDVLADCYGRSRWVSGLRHVEGFELPVIEGLACGARPIVFDRPDMRAWYDGLAEFVPECEGDALVDALTAVLRRRPRPVTAQERAAVVARFDWRAVAEGFWRAALAEQEERMTA